MSTQSGEPLWYCHECEAEMRPLMMPDPHCASCQGTFVEKLENPADDPRVFRNTGHGLDDPFSPYNLLASLSSALDDTPSSPDRQPGSPPQRTPSPMNRREIHFEFGTPGGRRHVIIGGPNTLGRREVSQSRSSSSETPGSSPPRLSDFLRANSEATGASQPRDTDIPGHLMAQYLFALLGGANLGPSRGSPFFGPSPGLSEMGPGNAGRLGDYVFSQEALDQLMTQLMEGSNSTRPAPATEEVMEGLPREVLEEGSALLEKDCAICKEQFNAKAEEPDEQVVVTLPCTHPFHEGCIMPWLKSSGTCPVCRFALVPQPNAHPPAGPSSSGRRSADSSGGSGGPGTSAGASSSGSAGANSSRAGSSPDRNVSSGDNSSPLGGFFSTFLSNFSGNNVRSSPARDRQQPRRGSRGSGSSNDRNHIPGGWDDPF